LLYTTRLWLEGEQAILDRLLPGRPTVPAQQSNQEN
jgi:hypothetical protein